MPSCSCALCLLGFAASPASVRWRRSQTKPMRMLGGLSANALSCCPIVSASRTESAPFWRRLGVNDYNALLQSRRHRLAELRTGLGEPIPPNALAKIERLLARLELVLAQIAELERERDEVRRPRLRTGPAR